MNNLIQPKYEKLTLQLIEGPNQSSLGKCVVELDLKQVDQMRQWSSPDMDTLNRITLLVVEFGSGHVVNEFRDNRFLSGILSMHFI